MARGNRPSSLGISKGGGGVLFVMVVGMYVCERVQNSSKDSNPCTWCPKSLGTSKRATCRVHMGGGGGGSGRVVCCMYMVVCINNRLYT